MSRYLVSIPKRVSEALKHYAVEALFGMDSFQSLKGFQRLWSSGIAILSKCAQSCVSIPKRVSEALKHYSGDWIYEIKIFQVSIPKRVSEALKHIPKYTGFSPHLFQSLKGFQRLWSKKELKTFAAQNIVSIPKRVSEALKLLWWWKCLTLHPVSIPKRVSEALKLFKGLLTDKATAFQSLKGFQRLWSLVEVSYQRALACELVSIPKRVSEALKLPWLLMITTPHTVSIPKRVSEALKLSVHLMARFLLKVSIPKRVSEALKRDRIAIWNLGCLFQSLKGFQRLWSIEIQFFINKYSVFQSLKGFQRLWSLHKYSIGIKI